MVVSPTCLCCFGLLQVPPVHTPVQIPASESLEKVTTIIIDSSANEKEQLIQKIKVRVGRRVKASSGGGCGLVWGLSGAALLPCCRMLMPSFWSMITAGGRR